jgi:hypothetical protein
MTSFSIPQFGSSRQNTQKELMRESISDFDIEQINRLSSLVGLERLTSSKEKAYYDGLVKSVQTRDDTFMSDTAQLSKEEAMHQKFIDRFKVNPNSRGSRIQEITKNEFDNTGLLGMNLYSGGEFQSGTLGYHDASVTGGSSSGTMELGSTNQNAIFAKSIINFSTDLFEKSTAFKPTMEKVSPWTKALDSTGQNNIYLDKDTGSPITLSTSGLRFDPEFMLSPNQPIGPDTPVYRQNTGFNDVGQVVYARDLVPEYEVMRSPGLVSLTRSEYEQSMYDYNRGTVNNWGRLGRVGDYGVADRSLNRYIPIDASVIPVVDVLESLIEPGINNPDAVAKKYSNKVDAKALIEEIKTRDPEFYVAMAREGIDFEYLATVQTAGEFRAHVNGTFQTRAISRAMQASKKNDGWLSYNLINPGMEAIYGTLVAGDAVGQTAITAATFGTNVGTAAALRASTMGARATRGATVHQRAIAMRGLVSRRLAVAEQISNGMQRVNSLLPINLPETLLNQLAKRGPQAFGIKNKAIALREAIKGSQGTSGLFIKSGAWALGQSIEGFVEEGFTNAINQGSEIALGLRDTFSFSEMAKEASIGALMEPVLGGVLMPGSLAVKYTAINGGAYGLNLFASSFNIDFKKAREFNEYLSVLKGTYSELSPLEKRARHEEVIRALSLELALGPYSDGAFSNAKDSHPKLGQMAVENSIGGRKLTTTNFFDAGLHLGSAMEKLNIDRKNNKLTQEQQDNIKKGIDEGLLIQDNSGQIRLSESTTEHLLSMIALGSLGDLSSKARADAIQRSLQAAVNKEVYNSNKDLIDKIQTETDPEKLRELQKELTEARMDAIQNLDAQVKAKIIAQQDLVLRILPIVSEQKEVLTLASETIQTINESTVRLQNSLGSFIQRIDQFQENLVKQLEELNRERPTAEAPIPVEQETQPTEAAQAEPEAAQAEPEAAQAEPEAVPEAAPVEPEVAPEAPEAAPVEPKVAQVIESSVPAISGPEVEILKTLTTELKGLIPDLDVESLVDSLNKLSTIEDTTNFLKTTIKIARINPEAAKESLQMLVC